MSNETKNEQHRVLALYKFVNIDPEKVPELQKEIESKLRSVRSRGTILLACEGINGTICYPEELALINDDNNEINGDDNGKKDLVLEYFHNHEVFSGVRTRISLATVPIFHRLKVKMKKEIVTMTGDDEDEDNCEALNTQSTVEENDIKEGDDCSLVDENSNDNSNPKKKLKPQQEKLKIDPTKVVGTYVKPGKEWDDLLMDPDVVVIDTRNKYEVEIGTFENAISPNTDNFRYDETVAY